MVRTPCCEKMGLKKGPWTAEEDQILISYVQRYGHDNWRALPKQAGLLRCGKSCRLRWTNYLRPDIKRGNFSEEEEETIIKLHQKLGNRWSVIATRLPGRTDNEIKNFWHTHLKKRLQQYLTTPTTVGQPIDVPAEREIDSARKSEPMNFPGSYSSVVTTMRPAIREEHIDASRTFLQIDGKLLSKNFATTRKFPFLDPRLSPVSTMEPMNGNCSNINEDMVFWYNLFMKAGESTEKLLEN